MAYYNGAAPSKLPDYGYEPRTSDAGVACHELRTTRTCCCNDDPVRRIAMQHHFGCEQSNLFAQWQEFHTINPKCAVHPSSRIGLELDAPLGTQHPDLPYGNCGHSDAICLPNRLHRRIRQLPVIGGEPDPRMRVQHNHASDSHVSPVGATISPVMTAVPAMGAVLARTAEGISGDDVGCGDSGLARNRRASATRISAS